MDIYYIPTNVPTRIYDQLTQFSHSVVSDSLWPHGLQHTRLPCPSSTPGITQTRPSSWWCHPNISSSVVPFSSCLQFFPSIRVFPNESVLHIQWPKFWSFSFNISPSNEYSGLISFRIDWLDLLAVQRTLKNLLQHHSSKASILRRSAFFTVQLSHPYMTTEKTIALTRRTFVGKLTSLLLNMLSRLVITFLPRSKRLLISWLQSPSVVICIDGKYLLFINLLLRRIWAPEDQVQCTANDSCITSKKSRVSEFSSISMNSHPKRFLFRKAELRAS